MLRSLRTKLMLSHLGLVLLAMILLTFYLVRSMEWFYLKTIQNSMRDEVSLLTERLAPDLASGNRDAIRDYLSSIDPNVSANVLVADSEGVIVGSTDPTELHLVGQPGLERGLGNALRDRIEQVIQGASQPSQDVVYSVSPIDYQGRQVGSIRVSYRLSNLYDQLANLSGILLLGLAVATGIGLLVSWVLAQSLSAPASALVAAARALSAGNLSYRIKPTGDDEIREAGRAFDGLADQLQRLERERQRLLGDVAHDLHSSITGVGMAVEALQQGAVDDSSTRSLLLDGLGSHTRRLHRMADDLLETARIEGGRLHLQREVVPASSVIRAVTAEFTADAVERGVTLEAREANDLPDLWVDPERLAQALGNLVENALRHTPEGKKVTLGGLRKDGECRLFVKDEGPGIPEQDLPKLFDRFNRFLEGRPGRLGFGLSIAKGLVEAHGGRIDVASRRGEGSTFSIALPMEAVEFPLPLGEG